MLVMLSAACRVFASEVSPQPVVIKQISLVFSVLGWDGEIKNLGYLKNNHLTPLKVSEFTPSAYYSYAGPAKMDLYMTDDRSASATVDKMEDKPVGSVVFDPELKRAMVLLSKTSEGYASVVIPVDRDKFPAGQARFQNLSSKPVSILCNKKTLVTIAPGEVKWVKPDDKNILDADMAYYDSDRWVKLERNYFPILQTQQTMIFFLKSGSDFFKTANGASVGGDIQVLTLRFPLLEAGENSKP